uniref:CalliFMRFamide-13 n=1 Tax=Calliphora vomitoria TaxID=27454 RepID=FARD_CALVO|nr:RecName: Full=CalliFMRFamide-13 [Calliphora vomitoria]
AGQDGFMRF